MAYCDYSRKPNKLNKDCCIDCLGKYKTELSILEWKEKENLTTKICIKCKREFPKTLEYFIRDNHRPDGLTGRCKECLFGHEVFNVVKETMPEGFKKCLDCGNVLEINELNFKTTNKSQDGFYHVCIQCQIDRRHKDCKNGYKKCKICNRELLISRDFYYEDSRCLDGYRNICRECSGENFYPSFKSETWIEQDINIILNNYNNMTIKEIIPLLSTIRTEKSILHVAQKLGIRKIDNYIEDYYDFKYRIIDNILHKYCKCCRSYLPNTSDYFPKDNICTDGLRNVCRECKGEQYVFNYNFHLWTESEKEIIKNQYPYKFNKELIELYFPFATVPCLIHQASILGVRKSNEIMEKYWDELGKRTSQRLLEISKWKGEDNPQYDSKRFGELNPNYKGGISALYQELRRNIKQWKYDSMENADYKCLLTNQRFENIHHIYSFDNIVQDTLNETGLPLYENISNYSDNELKQLIDKCLEIHYRHPLGICMTEQWHIQFHTEYGYGKNTEEQFYEFLEKFNEGKYKDMNEM
jgi:hypothetical protein